MGANLVINTPQGPASPEDAVILGDGFYPDIDANAMRSELRIDDTVTHEQLVAAVEGAIIYVTGQLASWRTEQEEAGFASMAAVAPLGMVNQKNRLEMLYRRAVRFQASSEIWELHRDISATTDGQSKATNDQLSSDEYERQATIAIRQIYGVTQSAVELI
tara:strand:+ start:8004 stop:8486 length:483 start_codon:yes stop_codon:yes gene_type:complete